jgi:hypothetical protein
MSFRQLARLHLTLPGFGKAERGKGLFSPAKRKVQFIHAAVNLDAKMHEAEDVCKYYLQLYAFISYRNAFMCL